MDEHGPVIYKHPLGLRETLDVHRVYAPVAHLLVDLPGYGFDVALARARADYKVVGNDGYLADVQHHYLFGFAVRCYFNHGAGQFVRFQWLPPAITYQYALFRSSTFIITTRTPLCN